MSTVRASGGDLLIPGLILYYKLNEASGTVINDSKGSYTGSLIGVGGTLGVAGKLETALLIDGFSATRIERTSAGMPITTQASFNLWLKLRVHIPANQQQSGIVNLNTVTQSSHYPFTDGNIYSSILTNVRKTVGVGIVADRTQWHMLTITANTSTNVYKVYQNGTLIFTGTVGTLSLISTLQFGRSQGGQTLDGTMDELSLWNVELTQANITDIYNGGAGINLL